MILRCIKLILLFSMLTFIGMASGKPTVSKQYSSPITLEDYIQSSCKVGCAGQEELLKSVISVASDLDIDFKDLLAIIKVESEFRIKAKSGKNRGLMQVNIGYHKKKFHSRNPFDLFANVEVGGDIYKECLVKYKGDKGKSLSKCYNGSKHSTIYSRKVLKAYKEISQLIDLEEKVANVRRDLETNQ